MASASCRKNWANLNATMEESISGQRVVKAFRRNESVVETFRQQQRRGL